MSLAIKSAGSFGFQKSKSLIKTAKSVVIRIGCSRNTMSSGYPEVLMSDEVKPVSELDDLLNDKPNYEYQNQSKKWTHGSLNVFVFLKQVVD